MKILFISPFPPLRGGISKETETLYEFMRKKNNVHVISYKRLYPDFLFPGKSQFLNQNKFIKDKNIISLIDSINPLTWRDTVKYIIDNKFQNIYVRYWHPFFIPLFLYIFRKIKLADNNIKIFCIADNIMPHDYFPFSNLLVKKLFNYIDKCFVMSDNTYQQASNFLKKENIKKVFLPIKNNFGQLLNQDKAKEKLGLKSNDRMMLFFGLVRKYKGLDVLLNSFKYIKSSKLKLFIVGECYEKKEKYIKLISNLKIDKYVKWFDEYIADDDVNLFFSGADIVVLPYKKASQSGIIPIAYNYNKPVLVSNIPGLIEFVEINKTGYVFENENSKSLANVLERNISNNKIQSEIQKYKKEFTVDKLCDDLLSFI